MTLIIYCRSTEAKTRFNSHSQKPAKQLCGKKKQHSINLRKLAFFKVMPIISAFGLFA